MPFLCDGADFDGTNDWMSRGAALDGDVDSKKFTISFWLRKDADVGAQIKLLEGDSAVGGSTFRGCQAAINQTTNLLQFAARNAAGTNIMIVAGSTAVTAGATWRHVVASFDLADTSKRHIYLDDVAETLAVSAYTDTAITFTSAADWGIGASSGGGNKTNGCLAEVMLFIDQYIDLSVEANRRMFIKANGTPEDPNITGGAIATLGTPIIYQHLDDAEAVANFATNRGSGGDFTITGTLETSDTSPSDGQEPVANFSGTPLLGTAPLTVTFTDSTTNDPTSWSWDFGDGGVSTSQNPTHEYTVAGTYDVALTATSNAGSDVETKTGYISVARRFVGAGVDVPTWEQAVSKRFAELNGSLKESVKQERVVVRKIAAAKKKLVSAKNPDGILANLHLLEQKRDTLTRQIKDLRLQIEWVNIQFDDEEDEELLLLQ